MARGLAIEGAKLKGLSSKMKVLTLTVRKQVMSTRVVHYEESKSIEMGSPIVKYVATSPGSTLPICRWMKCAGQCPLRLKQQPGVLTQKEKLPFRTCRTSLV